jgi:drug/metabolite transporter (DMT)-like permease
MKLKDIMALFILAALWGASFLFIRIASQVFGPLLTIQGRVTIAGVALLIFLIITRRSAYFKQRWKQYLIIGTLNAAIPFTLIATAELTLPASMSAILNSLTPLFTALVVWGWMNEKLTARKWVGIGVGTIGVAILVGWSSLPLTYETAIAIGISVLSTISYAFAGVYAKKAFAGVPPLALATGQQVGAAVILIPFTAMNLPHLTNNISTVAVLSVVGLALFCTAIAYLLYFYLIESVGPTKTLSVTFLIPIFGIVWGMIFLQEKLTFGMIIGLVIILSSVFLISEVRLKMPTIQKEVQS